MGRVDPHGRRADHVPRRRRRAAGPAPARARSRSWCWSCATTTTVVERCRALAAELRRRRRPGRARRAHVETSIGRRATDWELKGVPVRLEVGPRDLAEGVVTLVRRDRRRQGAGRARRPRRDRRRRSSTQPRPTLLAEATERRDAAPSTSTTIDEAVEAAATGFARIPWAHARRRGRGRAGQATASRCAACVTPDGSLPAPTTSADARRRRRPRLLTGPAAPSGPSPAIGATAAGASGVGRSAPTGRRTRRVRGRRS